MYLYFFLITLIILIILFNNTIEEKFSISNESVQTIYSAFLTQYLNLENINKLIFFNNNNNVNITGVLNAKNNFMIADTDIRQYFTGCILISMNPNNALKENGGNKRILQQGLYILNNNSRVTNENHLESSFSNTADIIIVFPGFGVYALENSLFTNGGALNTSTDLGQYIKIENYGKNPIKINLKNGFIITSNDTSNLLPSSINILPTNITYGVNSNAYKIVKSNNFTDFSKKINAINVYLLPMSVWNTHIAP